MEKIPLGDTESNTTPALTVQLAPSDGAPSREPSLSELPGRTVGGSLLGGLTELLNAESYQDILSSALRNNLRDSTLAAHELTSDAYLTTAESDMIRAKLRERGLNERDINERLSKLTDSHDSPFQSFYKALATKGNRVERLHYVLLLSNMTFGNDLQNDYNLLRKDIDGLARKQILGSMRRTAFTASTLDISLDAASLVRQGIRFGKSLLVGGLTAGSLAEVVRLGVLKQLDPANIPTGGLSFSELRTLYKNHTGQALEGVDAVVSLYDTVRYILDIDGNGLESFNESIRKNNLYEYSKLSAQLMSAFKEVILHPVGG
ncbi:MAG: hypothetical protein HYZ50_07410 [Deltaproteobacteria bacterium]|nr:hypothetical protein [Deltaproteobacteria bacterium]